MGKLRRECTDFLDFQHLPQFLTSLTGVKSHELKLIHPNHPTLTYVRIYADQALDPHRHNDSMHPCISHSIGTLLYLSMSLYATSVI